MKILNIISAVLFRLGLLISFIGIAVLAYFNFILSTVGTEEFDRVLTVTFIGLIMMLISIALDFIPTRGNGENNSKAAHALSDKLNAAEERGDPNE